MATDDIDRDWPPPAYDPSDDVDTTPPTEGSTGRSVWLVVALAVLVCVGLAAVGLSGGDDVGRSAPKPAQPATTAVPPPANTSAGNTPAPPCGPDETAALAAALAQVPPDRKTGKQWKREPVISNYDSCADLSAIVVTVQDGTNSSPELALMFHRGVFVGTATPTAYPFTDLEGAASTDDTVVLTYRTGQSCDGCSDGTLTTVGFEWKDNKVHMLDPPPESVDSP